MDINNTLGLIIDKLNRYDKVGASILLSSLSTEISSMNDDQKFEYFFHSARCYEMDGNFECMCQAANSAFNFSKNKEQKVLLYLNINAPKALRNKVVIPIPAPPTSPSKPNSYGDTYKSLC